MKNRFSVCLSFLLVLIFSVCLFSQEDIKKEAMAKVSKALKEKRISTQEMTQYYQMIYNGKAAEVINKLVEPSDSGLFGSEDFVPSSKKTVGWRGDGTGCFPGANPPLKWGKTRDGAVDNIAWEVETPSYSGSAPVIVKDKLFITSAPSDLLCLDKKSGKILWIRSLGFYDVSTLEDKAKYPDVYKNLEGLVAQREMLNKKIPGNEESWTTGTTKKKLQEKMDDALNFADKERFPIFERIDATTTPVSDGNFVYVLHNVHGILACYDLEGNSKWNVYINDPKVKFQHHGYTSGPLLIDGKVIVFFKGYSAFDAATGKLLWKNNGKEYQGLRYGTPVAVSGRSDLFVGLMGFVYKTADCSLYSAPDIKVGESWGGTVCSDGLVGFMHARGYGENKFKPFGWYKLPVSQTETPQKSICPDKPGEDMLKKEWSGNGQPIYNTFASTLLLYNGLAYTGSEGGGYSGRGTETPFLFAYDLDKGEMMYGKAANFETQRYSSPYSVYSMQTPFTMAGGKIFVSGFLNEIIILEPDKEYKEIARNKIAVNSMSIASTFREWSVATPTFEGEHIFLRSESHVYCIGKKWR